MENEENGVSISEIFKVIFKRVWWVVGVTLAFLLLFVLVVQFWLNRQQQTYTVTYTIDFPGIEEGVYPDGSTVRYSSVVSLQTLSEIVASDAELSGIDVTEMVKNDDIEFTQTVVTAENSTSGVAERYFTLTVGVRYFNDSEQAAAFLRAVANYPVTRAISIANDMAHDSYISVYDSADTFESKFDALALQRDYLLSMYDEMIAATSGEYSTGGRTLTNYRAEVALVYQGSDEEYLQSLINTTHYVYNYQKFYTEVDSRLAGITKQMEENSVLIDELEAARDSAIGSGQSGSYDVDAFNTLIAKYIEENASLQSQYNSLSDTKEWIEAADGDTASLEEDIATIIDELDHYRDLLSGTTEQFRTVYRNYFEEMCDVTFASNIIEAEGGINIILAAIIGAVIGFIVVSVVICIIDLPKYIKARDGENKDGENDNPPEDLNDAIAQNDGNVSPEGE